MTNPAIRIVYHQGLEPLEELLDQVQRCGDFYVHGALELPMPQVEVDGVGRISFPVPHAQIQQLVQHAERAPYGRGEQTIVDTSVRKVWQFSPSALTIGGKSWATSLQKIVDHVAAGLGCQGMSVTAELYKMLVYDEGAFFASHRDTEKSDGMFGTLVVVLPAIHRGGELVILHAGREVTVDVSTAEMSEMAFIAFYADCQHEVRPIIEGNRVCLVYNLIHRAEADGVEIAAPIYDAEVAAAATFLSDALRAPGAPKKIAWLLQHQYSPKGLSFTGLKHADAAQVKVLAQAASQAGCVMHLGIVHIEEAGSADPIFESYSSRRYSSSSRYSYADEEEDDDNENDNENDDDFDIVDVSDTTCYVDHWLDTQDRLVEFGQIPLADGELFPRGALDDTEPDVQRLTEATGNEGASFERSYHRAAVVFWPHERFAEVLLQVGVAAVLPYVQDQVSACGAASADPAARAQTIALAARVLDAWENPVRPHYFACSPKQPSRVTMLDALGKLGDETLLSRFIGGLVTMCYDGTENVAVTTHARLLAPESAGTLLAALIRLNISSQPESCVALLRSLLRDHHDAPVTEWTAAFQVMAVALVEGLNRVGALGGRTPRQAYEQPMPSPVLTGAELVVEVLTSLQILHADALRDTAVTYIVARPTVFDPGIDIVPAVALLSPHLQRLPHLHHRKKDAVSDTSVERLWTHAAEYLLARSEHPPAAPSDWRQAATLTCTCQDCPALQAFARDPHAQVSRFRVREDRRRHLQGVINKNGFDMTYTTDEKGSPKTLICTKTQRTYQRACAQYRADLRSFAELTKTRPRSPDKSTPLMSRMAEAQKRGET